MKKLLICLLTLTSLSSFAAINCSVTNQDRHFMGFNDNFPEFDSGEPFGKIKVRRTNEYYRLTYVINGEETMVIFQKEFLMHKKNPTGPAAGVPEILCYKK